MDFGEPVYLRGMNLALVSSGSLPSAPREDGELVTPSEHLTRIATTGRDHGRKAVIRMAGCCPSAPSPELYVASGSVEFGEKDRLTDGGIPEMASRFEISGHTLNPVRLTGPGKEEPEHITAGKWLPDDVTGDCSRASATQTWSIRESRGSWTTSADATTQSSRTTPPSAPPSVVWTCRTREASVAQASEDGRRIS